MKKITDEILNKLIDNELGSSEIDELYNLIKKDEKLLSKTKAHQMVDSVLKTLEIEDAPANTTDLIMQKISNSVLAKEEKNGFFKLVMGGFAMSILLVIGFIISSNPVIETSPETTFSSVREKALTYLQNFTFPINSDLLLIIASALTIIILISGYFVFEQHKLFKQKLDSIL